MGVIYKITNPSGRIYVGKTYNLPARIACHKSCAKKTTKAIILYNSIRKYGWDAHVLEVIEEVADEQLNDREIFWISELKTYHHQYPNGMNMTKGGDGQRSTWMHDLERRKKQSDRFRATGGNFYGRHHTEENKKIIAKKSKEWNLKHGWTIPKWGVEKGRLKVIKDVVVYDINGVYVAEYNSLVEAAEKTGISYQAVRDSVTYRSLAANKFIFQHKSANHQTKINIEGVQMKNRPVLFLNDEFQIMCEYPSPKEASKELQVPLTSIRRAALYNYLWPIRTGHVFIYKDIYESLNLDN